MLLLVVWIAVGVLAVVVLGSVAFLTFGAARRLGGEAAALQRELRPVLEQVQETTTRAEERRAATP